MIVSIYRAKGHSMEPLIKNGSFFIVSSLPFMFRDPKVGDIILFKEDNKNIVKKISGIKNSKYIVEGENKKDSLCFDPIKREDIKGKAMLII